LVTWWAIGNQDTGEEHLVGPFNLPAWVEPTVDAFGLGLLVVAFAAVRVPRLRRGPRLSAASVVLLALNAAFLAAAWRVVTAGVGGANIGGGLVFMVGPCVSSFLLAPVVFIEGLRHGLGSALGPLMLLTAMLGPCFLVLLLWVTG
jgi:hypothetical protein